MMELDQDLASIQESRELVRQAHEAWKSWSRASQEQVDRACAAMAEAGVQSAERLGRMAQEETGFGVAAHKKLKNVFAARMVWESIRELKTVGVIRHDPAHRLYEIAWPMGVVAALVPSTNPTSTTFFKSLIAVKARNAIVFAPHPSARRCTHEAAQTMAQAAENAGVPRGLIQCIQKVSLPGTQELMTHRQTALILATGGTPMVRAAHSTGKPAYGVGPGNVPVYVDRSADLEKAARYIVASKAFDHSTICATEQAVVADLPIAGKLAELFRLEGAYFTSPQETDALRRTVFHPDGNLNTRVVGRSAAIVAEVAGFRVPAGTRILVTPLTKVGRDEPLSHEKMTTVLAWYTADGWEQGCELSI
ncbi:MAG: aldehyde dehydrogenase family protein, partial [Anaerolineales bacterium]|nr:aldehyde dehydrogenase family protein [Anaerolineales bacterium]